MTISWVKAAGAAALISSALYAPSSAQGYYRSLNGSDGCLIDVGRTAAPNSYYDYNYTVSNRCEGCFFTIYYTVNGRSMRATIGYGNDFSYPLKNSDSFQITAVEE